MRQNRRPLKERFTIVRIPDATAFDEAMKDRITSDGALTYELVGDFTDVLVKPGQYPYAEHCAWHISREPTTVSDLIGVPFRRLGFGTQLKFEWDVKPGRYILIAEVIDSMTKEHALLTLPQHVMSEDEVDHYLFQGIHAANKAGLPHPDTAVEQLDEYIALVKQIATSHPPAPDLQKKHEKEMKQLAELREKTHKLLLPTATCHRVPLPAVHLDMVTGIRRQLNVFLAITGRSPERVFVELVDWSNPASPLGYQSWEGVGKTLAEAIESVFADWDDENRLPTGRVKYLIPRSFLAESPAKRVFDFETSGQTDWDVIMSGLEFVVLGAGLLAIGITTLGTGVPAGAGILGTLGGWGGASSLLASTAGATAGIMGIAQRRSMGVHDTKADFVAVLSILSGIFAAPEKAFVKGATLIVKNGKAGERLGTYVFYGVVKGRTALDMASGIVLAIDSVKEYESIMTRTDLTPSERALQMELFLLKASAQGALSVVAIRQDLDDRAKTALRLKEMKDELVQLDIKALADSTRTIDTTQPAEMPGAVGRRAGDPEPGATKPTETAGPEPTKEGSRTIADTGLPGARFNGVENFTPLAELPAGMRAAEHNGFKNLSHKKILVVREGADARLAAMERPELQGRIAMKNDKVKFKTAKPPNSQPGSPEYGLVVDGNKDAHVKQLLDRHGWKWPEDKQKLFKHVEETEGLRIEHDEPYRVTQFVGGKWRYLVADIDLHGAYRRRNGSPINTNDKSFQKQVNNALGAGDAPAVLHGGHANWSDAMNLEKAGINYGPQPPFIAYVDGEAYRLSSWVETVAWGKQYNIDFNAQFKGFDMETWMHNLAKWGKRDQVQIELDAYRRLHGKEFAFRVPLPSPSQEQKP